MVSAGQIQAKINSEQKTIIFIDSSSVGGKEQEALREREFHSVIGVLEKQNQRIIQLMKTLDNINVNIKNSKEFIQKQLQVEKLFEEVSSGRNEFL
mmetsp:Transcript_6432/g.4848  ORF Transcript_6432/g.4848 Transcript_6432/m.4848 type:complete len:96 (+) Transcript_6432:1028-1315(+)